MAHRIAVYPASLDPIHYGHIDVAMRAAKLFDEIIVAVYDLPKKKLLFSPDERVALAEEALQDYSNIKVAKYSGLTVENTRSPRTSAIAPVARAYST
ncbi:MAG: adenylyltransferase/cytidyltransferase family protein, partial [Chloroflexota bacterium]